MASRQTAAVVVALAWGVGAVEPSLQARITAGECWDSDLKGLTLYPTVMQARSDVFSAELFEIKYGDAFKVVASKMVKEQYVLTQCGQAKPTEAQVNALAPLGSNYSRKYFTVPLQSVAAMSTVQLAFLEALGVEDRASFVSKYATSPCWLKAIGCGAALEDPARNATRFQLQTTSVDAVLMDCAPTGCDNVRARPNGVHIPTAHDSNMLGIAEYVKYIGAFFNKEPLANDLFAAVKTAYQQASSGANRTLVVAWINFNKYGGPSWDQPEFVVSQAAYKRTLVSDAGASNLDAASALAGVTGLKVTDAVPENPAAGRTYSVPVSAYADKAAASARFFAALGGVDVVVDEVYAYDPRLYTYADFLSTYGLAADSSLKFVQNKMVLRVDRTMAEGSLGLDWYESRLAHPDYAVQGLARVLLGDATKPPRYFRNVAKGEEVDQILSSSACTKTLPACTSGTAPVAIQLKPPAAKEVGLAASGSPSLFGLLLVSVVAAAGGLSD